MSEQLEALASRLTVLEEKDHTKELVEEGQPKRARKK